MNLSVRTVIFPPNLTFPPMCFPMGNTAGMMLLPSISTGGALPFLTPQKADLTVGFEANIIENHDEPRGATHYLPAHARNEAGVKMLAATYFYCAEFLYLSGTGNRHDKLCPKRYFRIR